MGAHVILAETERTIGAYADGLERAGASTPVKALRMVAGFLREFSDRSMSELAQCKPKMRRGSASGDQDEVLIGDTTPHLKALEKVARTTNGDAHASDLRLLIKLLGDDSRYLAPMLDALRRAFRREEAVGDAATFIDRLNKDMGTEAFEQTLSELGNSRLSREQVVRVALAVYGGIPKSTSRKAALKFIRKPHDARVSARRGIDAMGGRSAA
jgi:hypothetical protein